LFPPESPRLYTTPSGPPTPTTVRHQLLQSTTPSVSLYCRSAPRPSPPSPKPQQLRRGEHHHPALHTGLLPRHLLSPPQAGTRARAHHAEARDGAQAAAGGRPAGAGWAAVPEEAAAPDGAPHDVAVSRVTS
uniref:Uncharacterized protein n=1 Tax=Aegilops tauschii subsp. strangulata TaxID=200361 RepID=A0A453LY93_AEGTS